MRVAALHNVHGNLPALEAVLADVERTEVDQLVFGGDVAAGLLPVETIERLLELEGARFVMGNADRILVADMRLYPNLAAWQDRMEARPAFKRMLAAARPDGRVGSTAPLKLP